jgi:hypothetical protein
MVTANHNVASLILLLVSKLNCVPNYAQVLSIALCEWKVIQIGWQSETEESV